jgi:phosphoribosyl 1,2-cyclic phosphate phosphodiesterase
MKLKYYGTAAAEGFPGLFCDCEACRKARQAGGKNIRTRSQALVDDTLLIDFPPDTYLHVLHYGLDLKPITACIVTHAHTDHLYPIEFEMRRHGYAYAKGGGPLAPLDIYLTEKSAEVVRQTPRLHAAEDETIRINTVVPFAPFPVGGYTVTALKADHDVRTDPVIYMISKDKTMLYGNDTGYFLPETWEYLEKTKPYFHYVSLDCTGITKADYRTNHMCLETNIEVRDRLIAIGCADENTVFCVHHFSHNGGLIHDELVPVAAEHGFLVSYDTMEVEF